MTNPLDKVREDQERLKQHLYKQGGPMPAQMFGGGEYFYAYGWKETKNWRGQLITKLYTDGPFMSKRDAELKLAELDLDAGDIHTSKSRDLQRAKKEIAALLTHQANLPVDIATGRKYRK